MSEAEASIERATLRAVTRRLLPFLFGIYIFNVIDRTNIAMAALQMNRELAFTPAVFGVGAGIFFLGYSLLEVPSNMILARTGARRWIARIMITWGLIAAATILVHSANQFYALRFLLGAAEAGFFPGIIFYLAQWFPSAERATATSRFMIAVPLAATIGGPLGAALLSLDGVWHLSGWQWLLLVEGLPSAFLGVVALLYLDDGPQAARWLSPSQRAWLSERIQSEQRARAEASGPRSASELRVMMHPAVWLLAVPYFLALTVWYSYSFWVPLLVRDGLEVDAVTTGWIVGGIAAVSALAMLAVGRSSDLRRERCAHAALSIIVAGIGCIGAALLTDPVLRVLSLGLVSVGGSAFLIPFWCLPTMIHRDRAAAVAIALVSSIGSIGGFVGPSVVGFLRGAAGGDRGAFLALGAAAFAAGAMCLMMRRAISINASGPSRSPSSAGARRSPASEP